MIIEYDQNKHNSLVELALKLEEQPPSRFRCKDYDERVGDSSGFAAISNEPNLYETFPYLQEVRGTGLGIGLDQMLDILVNSQLDEIYVLDVTPHVSLTTTALLEVGRRHRQLFGDITTEIFLEYFKPENIGSTLKVIEHEFETDELAIIEEQLRKRLEEENNENESLSGPPAIYRYLEHKATQTDYISWVSTDDNLKRIFDLYEKGKIQVINGDLAGEKSMASIVSLVDSDSLSIVYLSNALHYLGRKLPGFESGSYDSFRTNFEALPTSDETIVITTNQLPSKGIPKPVSVSGDLYLDKAFTTWEYILQTVADKKREDRGEFTVVDSGQKDSVSLFDRKWLHDERNLDMGIRTPKAGLYLAGL